MKLRPEGDSVRVRLDRRDVETLLFRGRIDWIDAEGTR